MKVGVVGGGIAGLVFSHSVRSFDVEIFEEHLPGLEPPHCTGLISYNAYALISRVYSLKVLGFYSRVEFYSSTWRRLVVEGRGRLAVLVDRKRYETVLRNSVEGRGHVIVNGRVERVSRDGRIVLRGGSIKQYDLVVLSEGAAQYVSRTCKLVDENSWRANVVRGLQLDMRVKGGRFKDDTITVILNHKYAPGYYGWAIPYRDGELVRIGVGGRPGTNLLVRLTALIRALERRMRVRLEAVERPWGGLILTRGPSILDHKGRVVRLGDSAYHVKPASGGGIYTSYVFARQLGLSLERKGLEGGVLDYYKGTWDIRRSLILQTPIAKVFHLLDDARRNSAFKVASEREITRNISKLIDYDRHEQLFKAITLSPRAALKLSLKALTPTVFISSMKCFLSSLTG